MNDRNRWPARGALLISIVMFGGVMGVFAAFGLASQPIPIPIPLQTSASPSGSASASPSPSPTPCRFAPAPPPVCPSSPSPSGSPKPSGSPSPSTSPTPGGDTEKHDSKITINYTAAFRDTPAQFDGLVRSVEQCKAKREVVLKRIQAGPNLTVGTDTTNRAGKWRIVEGAAKGRYYAKLLKRVFNQGDVKVVCGAARSTTVRAS